MMRVGVRSFVHRPFMAKRLHSRRSEHEDAMVIRAHSRRFIGVVLAVALLLISSMPWSSVSAAATLPVTGPAQASAGPDDVRLQHGDGDPARRMPGVGGAVQ